MEQVTLTVKPTSLCHRCKLLIEKLGHPSDIDLWCCAPYIPVAKPIIPVRCKDFDEKEA